MAPSFSSSSSVLFLVCFALALICSGSSSPSRASSSSSLDLAASFFPIDSLQQSASLQDVFRAARALQIVSPELLTSAKEAEAARAGTKAAAAAGVASVCADLREQTEELPASVTGITHLLQAVSILGCLDVITPPLSKAAEFSLLAAVSGSDVDLLTLTSALKGLEVLQGSGWLSSEGLKDAKDLGMAVAHLQELEWDGLWRYSVNEKEGSVQATAHAFEAMASLFSLKPELLLQKISLESVKRTVRKLFDLAVAPDSKADASSTNGPVFFGGSYEEGGVLSASAAVARGFASLSSRFHDDFEVDASKLVGLAVFFSTFQSFADADEAYFYLEGVDALSSSEFVPLAISAPSVLPYAAEVPFTVLVKTAKGSPPAGDVTVTLLSLRQKTGRADIVREQVLEVVKDGEEKGGRVFAGMLSLPPEASLGIYHATFQVESSDAKELGTVTKKTLKLSGHVDIKGMSVEVARSSKGSSSETPAQRVELTYGKDAASAVLQATHLENLILSFQLLTLTGRPFIAQQVFALFSHAATGIQHLFLVPPPSASSDTYRLQLVFLELMEKWSFLSGNYSLKLMVGDVLLDSAFTWELGIIDVSFPDSSSAPGMTIPATAAAAALNPAMAEEEFISRYSAKKEIVHMFRQPEKQPPLYLSTWFALLQLLPLLLLLAGLQWLGVNLKLFPTSGAALVSALAFHLAIAGLLSLFVFFWLTMKYLFTLKLLALAAVTTTVAGYLTLANLAAETSALKQKQA